MLLMRGLGVFFGGGVFVFVSKKKFSSIFGVFVFSFDVCSCVVLCVGHGQVSSYGQGVDGEDCAGSAFAVWDVACWGRKSSDRPCVSALVSTGCGVAFAVVWNGGEAAYRASPDDGVPDVGSG
jgi:multisubunit Na+/H+ antiporter MnhC subunit